MSALTLGRRHRLGAQPVSERLPSPFGGSGEHGGIKAGDRYMICTEYPGGDSGYADSAGRPVRLVLCEAHSMRDFPGGPVSAGGEDR